VTGIGEQGEAAGANSPDYLDYEDDRGDQQDGQQPLARGGYRR
jgi:hypothetical protein